MVAPLSHLTCTPAKFYLYFDSSFPAVTSKSAIYRLLTLPVPKLMSIFFSLGCLSKESVQAWCPMWCFITSLIVIVRSCYPHIQVYECYPIWLMCAVDSASLNNQRSRQQTNIQRFCLSLNKCCGHFLGGELKKTDSGICCSIFATFAHVICNVLSIIPPLQFWISEFFIHLQMGPNFIPRFHCLLLGPVLKVNWSAKVKFGKGNFRWLRSTLLHQFQVRPTRAVMLCMPMHIFQFFILNRVVKRLYHLASAL